MALLEGPTRPVQGSFCRPLTRRQPVGRSRVRCGRTFTGRPRQPFAGGHTDPAHRADDDQRGAPQRVGRDHMEGDESGSAGWSPAVGIDQCPPQRPAVRSRPHGNPLRPGRERLDSRKALCGILFVLYTGIRWEFLPQELGFGSGMTCWRRLWDWNAAGVWQRLHELLLSELRAADLLDFLPRSGRLQPHPRDEGRAGHRSVPGGPGQGRQQAPPDRRGARHPARLNHHQRQPQRRHATDPADPGRPADPRQAWTATAPPLAPGRRPRRARGLPGRGPPVPDHPLHRPARRRARLRPGRVPLGRGRSDGAAALVPPPAYPLGDPRRHPPCVRHPWLRRHLLATTAHRTLLRVRAGIAPGDGLFDASERIRSSRARAAPHIRDLSTSISQPGADGSKPCSISQRTASRLRNDHHAWITSRSMSVP